MINLRKLLGFDESKELIALKQELANERAKNLQDIKLINKKLRAVITSGEVEVVIKNIEEIRRNK